jgi:hypothetical protein
MKPIQYVRIALVAIACSAATAVFIPGAGSPRRAMADEQPGRVDPPVEFDADGAMLRPSGYREWTQVGTPVTPNDMNDGEAPFPEFHSVYISPDAWAAYKRTGAFPDGTVMIKELISVGGKKASSGNGYFMGDFIGLEVSMKDSSRFSDQPGYWSYFSFGHEYPLADAAMAEPAVSCNVCHEVNARQDYVFTQYYPVLRAAAARD